MSNQRSSQNNDTVRTTPTNHDLLNPTERGQIVIISLLKTLVTRKHKYTLYK